MSSQNFGVSQISYSLTGLKAGEEILGSCTQLGSQEVTITEENTLNEFMVHGCEGVDEQSETGSKTTITFSIKRDMEVLKAMFPDRYIDGAQAGEYFVVNNAGKKSQRMSLKIRPLGATDDTDAILYYSVLASVSESTTATAAGEDMVTIVCKVSSQAIDGSYLTNVKAIGIDFPVA